jgi:hypothetical protein
VSQQDYRIANVAFGLFLMVEHSRQLRRIFWDGHGDGHAAVPEAAMMGGNIPNKGQMMHKRLENSLINRVLATTLIEGKSPDYLDNNF